MLIDDELYVASRKYLIDYGMRQLNGLGADQICKVCIQNGGSCCRACSYLVDGVGCLNRNTSCTSWLCGYLKLLFYKAGLIQEWNTFWKEVPGIDFRKDYTPPLVKMTKHLEVKHRRELGEALANDINMKISKEKDNIDFIVLASELDELIDEIGFAGTSDIASQLIKRLNYLIKDFHAFKHILKSIDNGS
ncbi:hypothetical protein [Paenibacillus oryzisoli]|uniref:DNA mismatch repair protein n=1 Tax=Paenibacillus oryzisoli TaxID=1850517 RepID=A0A198AIQ3_9BACL|nr:hypothetical protein [Paenibacillus oryzisoli]OAS21117.1 hypothetical protein A8708_29955 [Paenibacillus oryzisoli]